MRRGKFITLEGIDGAGKTSQSRRIADWLRSRGLEVVETREPGGTEKGEKLRQILLQGGAWRPESELLLLFAARVEHLAHKILPALERGVFVVCDRFLDSTYAYQGFGRGLPCEQIETLAGWWIPRRPDLTFWLDLPPDLAVARLEDRGLPDGFEQKAFLERVREGYRWLWQRERERIIRIDASIPLEAVWREIKDRLERWLSPMESRGRGGPEFPEDPSPPVGSS